MRTLVKTITYRAISATSTIGLAYLFTGSLELAGSFGLLDMVANSGIYYGYEHAWNRFVDKGGRV